MMSFASVEWSGELMQEIKPIGYWKQLQTFGIN